MIESCRPTNTFTRQVTDVLGITEKLVKQKRIIEKLANYNVVTEYNKRNNNIAVDGLLKLQDNRWVISPPSPMSRELAKVYNTVRPLLKDFAFMKNMISMSRKEPIYIVFLSKQ